MSPKVVVCYQRRSELDRVLCADHVRFHSHIPTHTHEASTDALISTFLINPRRACAARVGLSVSLSVRLYSRTTGNDAAYERYQQL